jgi:hypothetical protein
MATVSKPLREKAESIFTELGYVVSPDGGELRAERKWRVVHVTPIDDSDDPPSAGTLRCFVTWSDRAADVYAELSGSDLDYEWAVIAVEEDDEYEVVRAPTTPCEPMT